MTSELDESHPVPPGAAPEPGSLADRLAGWTPPWSRPADDPPAVPVDSGVPDERAADEPPAVPVDLGVPDEPADDKLSEPVNPGVPGEPTVDEPPAVPVDLGVPDEPAAADEPPVGDAPADPEGMAGAEPEVTGRPAAADADEPESPAGDQPAEPAPDAEGGELPELDDPALLRAALEAMLIVVDEPVAERVLAETVQRPVEVVAAALAELAAEYTAQRRGFELRRAAGGWRIYTRDEFAAYVERFVLEGQQVRLTQAALETLAVVAYKQPVSRGRVSAIRGVNCDGVIRTLLSRGLIEECGTDPDSGAHLYRTTTLFLERMGINSVDELPELAPFLPDDLPEDADGG